MCVWRTRETPIITISTGHGNGITKNSWSIGNEHITRYTKQTHIKAIKQNTHILCLSISISLIFAVPHTSPPLSVTKLFIFYLIDWLNIILRALLCVCPYCGLFIETTIIIRDDKWQNTEKKIVKLVLFAYECNVRLIAAAQHIMCLMSSLQRRELRA